MTLTTKSKEVGGQRSAGEKPGVDEQWMPEDLHGGQRDERGEGSGGDGGDAIVIEGQQSH